MGRAKEKYLEDEERGFSLGDNIFVCEDHFDDSDIKSYIRTYGTNYDKCFFCDTDHFEDESFEHKYSIHIDTLLEGVVTCIKRSYDDPANGLAYESSEGGYIGNTYSTLELLNDIIPLNADYEVIEYIADCINQDIWTEEEFYGDKYHEELSTLWNNFSHLIKNRVRYLFNEVPHLLHEDNNYHKPLYILNTIADFIINLNLFTSIPKKTTLFNQAIVFYRARQHKYIDEIRVCKDICSPPNDKAGANRFSAEGISMFYGAENEKTALEEIINRDEPNEYITISEFYSARQLTLIDLRNNKKIGFFNFENVDLYEPSQFLVSFVHQVSKKLNPNQNKRIEFVPSQVVTEFFKHVLPSKSGKSIDGLVYKSAQNIGFDCYVIFADFEKCSDENNIDDETLLVLKKDSLRTEKVSKL